MTDKGREMTKGRKVLREQESERRGRERGKGGRFKQEKNLTFNVRTKEPKGSKRAKKEGEKNQQKN